MLIDISKFGKIFSTELIKLKSEPLARAEYTFVNRQGKRMNMEQFTYNNPYSEFLLYQGQVVRITVYPTSTPKDEPVELAYSTEAELLKMFNLETSAKPKLTALGLKFENVDRDIEDFWILGDAEKKTFYQIKVTYNTDLF